MQDITLDSEQELLIDHFTQVEALECPRCRGCGDELWDDNGCSGCNDRGIVFVRRLVIESNLATVAQAEGAMWELSAKCGPQTMGRLFLITPKACPASYTMLQQLYACMSVQRSYINQAWCAPVKECRTVCFCGALLKVPPQMMTNVYGQSSKVMCHVCSYCYPSRPKAFDQEKFVDYTKRQM